MKNFVVNNIVNELKWGRQLTTAAAVTVTQPFHKFQVNLIDKAKYKWNNNKDQDIEELTQHIRTVIESHIVFYVNIFWIFINIS